ncbi:MAG: BTAD domain-containing putative transcriptional regulator, partial [Gaiellaceae bacterium]
MEYLVLGPLEVRNGEQTVRLGAAKQRALLGVLLLHANETVSTSRLVDELWGDEPPATAEKLVQGYVHALRKQLGDGVVETRAPGYKLKVEPRSLDLLEFERLTEEARTAPVAHAVELRRRALALWRGPPLADVALEGPDRHTLARLAELRLSTQVDRIEAELELGRHAQLIGELEALVAEHPYQERAAALLMLALYRSGRQAEALEVYRAVRRRLSDELGLQPGQELRDIETAILRQDDTLAAPIAASEAAPVAEAAPTEPKSPAARGPRRRRRLALGGAVALLAVVAAAVAVLVLRDNPAPVVVPPNSVAAIDPATNRVLPESILQTGIEPGPVAAGAGSIWVGNLEDRSLTRIDPATGEVVSTIPLPATPDAITFGRGALWVVSGRLGTLYRVDPEFETLSEPKSPLGPRPIRSARAGADVGEGSVWAAYGDSTLARVDPETLRGTATTRVGQGPARWSSRGGSSGLRARATTPFGTSSRTGTTWARSASSPSAGLRAAS